MLFDVVGLYPHIPHEEGLEILKCFLDKPEDQLVSSENLCRLAKIINIIIMLCVSILFHHFVSVCVLHLSCVYVVTSSTNVHPIHFIYQYLIHFIYHSPSLLYLPYLVMLMLHCHSALFSRYIKKHDFYLNMFTRELISRLMHQSLISRT